MPSKKCPICNAGFPLDAEVCPHDGARLELIGATGEGRQHASDDGLAAGKVVGGKYSISGRVGEDEVSAIYQARTLALNAPRIIRVLRPAFAADEPAADEFRRTGALLQKVAHANVIAVEGLGNAEGGQPYLVTEFTAGRTLAEVLRVEAPLEPLRVCVLARQVAGALEAAHRKGLLHLSLNPSNILVFGGPGEESVKLQGFGAAQVRMTRTRNGSTATSVTLRDHLPADPRYTSPEEALGTPANLLDERADLYSLGVVMYEMLTGRPPFPLPESVENQTEADLAVLVAHLENEPAPLEAGYRGQEVPPYLAAIVMQLLEKRQELRPYNGRAAGDKIALAESRITARALLGTRLGAVDRKPVDLLEVAAPAERVPAEPAEEPAGPPLPPPATSVEGVLESLVLEQATAPGVERTLAAGMTAEAQMPEAPLANAMPQTWRRGGSALFGSEAPKETGHALRWVFATVSLLVLGLAAWFFIIRSRQQQIVPGPLSPVRSDELHPAQGAQSAASSATQPAGASQAAAQSSAATGQQTQGQAGTAQAPDNSSSNSPQAAAPSQPGTTSAASAGGKPGAATSPPAGRAQTGKAASGATAPAPTGTPSAAGAAPSGEHMLLGPKPALSSDELAAEVQRAVSAGDVFFELGQYDLAIRAYEGPLKDDPKNNELHEKIDRAKRAKAAEEKYLGQ